MKNKKETRVSRYSRKNRIKRKIKSLGVKGIFKIIGKELLKNSIYLVVGFVYSIYLLIRGFDNLIAKLFMKLPRLMKVAIIYLLVINLGVDVYSIFDINKPIKEMITVANVVETKNIPVNFVVEEPKEEICNLDSTSCKIVENAKKIGLNEEQILISIAISKWETGNYTSSAFKNKNNVGGMMCSSGLISYNSLDDGINAFLKNLKNNYFDIGLDTLEKIQPKYCPIGAANDPNGLNQYWLNGTNQMLNQMKNK